MARSGLTCRRSRRRGGAGLLRITPPGAFDRIVPVLVLAGSLALLAQPRLTSLRQQRAEGGGGRLLLATVGVLSVYSGYFGAGSGVMLLAALAVLLDSRLPRANAVKNMLIGASAVASAVVLILAPRHRRPLSGSHDHMLQDQLVGRA